MRLVVNTLTLGLALVASQAQADKDNHTDFVQTCNENGFASESFTVISDDDYVYQLYRIPGKAGEDSSEQKPVVLMMAGLECDMNFWTSNDADIAPPFVLADQGYDVWLGNNRGTRFGGYHTTLDRKKDAEYWRFSQEELGLEDLPTFIDHILETTGQEQLTYIGHSQGTTQMFLGASLDPDYFSKRVNLFVALAPVTSLVNCKVKAFHASANIWRELEYLVHKFRVFDMFNFTWLEESALQLACNELQDFCYDFVHQFSGGNDQIDNMERWDVLLKDYPAGNGYQNLVYYMQSMENPDTWLRYDFGAIRNMDKYGQLEPPAVPLSQLSVPTGLFIGTEDKLATVEDSQWLETKLSQGVLVWNQTYDLDHLSFSMARDMSFFTVDVMNLVNQYATNSFAVEQQPTLISTN